jgi:asparagine synthetase B (glutamine-hydrolysing)
MAGLAIHIEGSLDPIFAWNGERLLEDGDLDPGAGLPHRLRGAAASVRGDADLGWRILRDPLGINKLFWVRDDTGAIVLASRPRRLVDAGHRFEDIRAVPSGSIVDLPPRDQKAVHRSIRPPTWFSDATEERSPDEVAGRIRSTLERYMNALATAHPSARVTVCLSGGLDSTGIAAIAREFFPNLVAASFDLARSSGRASEDRNVAVRVAKDLGIPLLDVTVTADALFEHLDSALVEGIDWRDFNVHTALVNAALAESIRSARTSPDERAIVLTGDLANEFLIDYHAEDHAGIRYYALPRLEPLALRTSLVRGLDSCHREVGIFSAWGLHVIQPYAVAVDDYLTLPAQFLRTDDRKQLLIRAAFGGLVPGYVYTRPKVRAQMGSPEGGGVLAACVERGIDSMWLRRRFSELHRVDARELDRFIRGGVYRNGIPSTGDFAEHR